MSVNLPAEKPPFLLDDFITVSESAVRLSDSQ